MKLKTEKRLTAVLGVFCATFMLTALAFKFGLATHYSLLTASVKPIDLALRKPLQQMNFSLPPLEYFSDIDQRTLFSDNRRPKPIVKPADVPAKPAIPEIPLNATLLGIVVKNNKKVVLLKDQSRPEVIRVLEGQPLPGELGGWRVEQITPRMVIFDGGSQGKREIKLATSGAAPAGGFVPSFGGGIPQPMPGQIMPQTSDIKPNPAAMSAPPATTGMSFSPPPPPPPGVDAEAQAREQEVQRIIEQRRAQMRAEAERLSGQEKQ
jgi:hypothetical protein